MLGLLYMLFECAVLALFWRSLPDSRSRGRRSSLESAPIYITPRKKLREKQCGAVRLPVSPPLVPRCRSQ